MKLIQRLFLRVGLLVLAIPACLCANPQKPAHSETTLKGVPVPEFIGAIRQKAKTLEASSGMRNAFRDFLAAHHYARRIDMRLEPSRQ